MEPAADLVDQVRGQVVLGRLFVHAGQGQCQPLREFQLEFVPAVVTQRAAKAHYGRLGHLRATRQRGDVLADGGGRVLQHRERDLSLRLGERVELGADGVE